MQLATDNWVMKNNGRLGSKNLGLLLQIGAIIINQVHSNVNWKINFYLKAFENSQTKLWTGTSLLQNFRSLAL